MVEYRRDGLAGTDWNKEPVVSVTHFRRPIFGTNKLHYWHINTHSSPVQSQAQKADDIPSSAIWPLGWLVGWFGLLVMDFRVVRLLKSVCSVNLSDFPVNYFDNKNICAALGLRNCNVSSIVLFKDLFSLYLVLLTCSPCLFREIINLICSLDD